MLADLDCFFVEVERLHQPALRGVPVVIGGRPGGRGVVAACSYEARELGIRSALPMAQAYRLVKEHGGIVVEGPPEEGSRFKVLGSRGEGKREEGTGNSGERDRSGRAMLRPNSVGRSPAACGSGEGSAGATPTGMGGASGSPVNRNGGQGRPPSQISSASLRACEPLPACGSNGESQSGGRDAAATGMACYFLHDDLFGNYDRYSKRIQDVIRSEVPVFKAKSIDEFEMDISGCERLFKRDFGGIVPFAEHLRRRVLNEVGLKLSIGIAPSRIVAKMASRHAKPDGVFRVMPGEEEAFLGPHDVQAVPGIGPATSSVLRNLGINRVEQLLNMPERLLASQFGIVMPKLMDALRGITYDNGNTYFGYEEQPGQSDEPGGIKLKRKPKTIGHETTFERDEIDPATWKRTLWRLTEDACRRLRAADLRCRHVTLKIRYSDFATHTHGGFMVEATDVDRTVFERVKELFAEGNTRRLRIRLLGVRLSSFSVGASQGRLFEAERETSEQRLVGAVDAVREKHGKELLLSGPGVMKLVAQRQVEAMATAGITSGFMHGRE